MRRVISTAVVVLVSGLSVPGLVSPAHAVAPLRVATAACSITTPSGECYQAGEFCSRVELGESTTAADGAVIHCVQDGQERRWLGTDAPPSAPPSGATPGSGNGSGNDTGSGSGNGNGSGPAAAGPGAPMRMAPLGGVSAGGGGLALAADRQVATAPQSATALPAGLAAGAFAVGIGGLLVVRRRRATDRR